jgi:hypothetical protein
MQELRAKEKQALHGASLVKFWAVTNEASLVRQAGWASAVTFEELVRYVELLMSATEWISESHNTSKSHLQSGNLPVRPGCETRNELHF